ncbi:hypothetical protein [Nocardia anaemiae]|uniref:hypothetical protein n=1 Tax=Nocardia anaemiae TaxID=263910 RepID=UPI0012F51CF1|nr:hypothetical protein [Nocardia anaemiae]
MATSNSDGDNEGSADYPTLPQRKPGMYPIAAEVAELPSLELCVRLVEALGKWAIPNAPASGCVASRHREHSGQEGNMDLNSLHTTGNNDGTKKVVWRLVGRAPQILRVEFPAEAFTAYRLPSRTQLPEAQPGTIMFDSYPDLVDARELLPEHGDCGMRCARSIGFRC